MTSCEHFMPYFRMSFERLDQRKRMLKFENSEMEMEHGTGWNDLSTITIARYLYFLCAHCV